MSLVVPVIAQGLFDKECPECNGTGEVTCDDCNGSGTDTITVQCSNCRGTGDVEPTVTLESADGWGTLSGLDWVARVEVVFHNEEDVGTYGVAKSEVKTVTTTYTHTSPRTYFPPHQDVDITIDTPEVDFLEDWAYTVYLYSVDDITCPECDGIGAGSTISDCPDCDGTGDIVCSLCNGLGYVSDPNKIWTVAILVVGIVIIASVSAFVVFKRRKRH